MPTVGGTKNRIICDLDGTIALDEARAERYLRKPHANYCAMVASSEGTRACTCGWKRDWEDYFAACGEDKPNDVVIDILKMYWDNGFQIHILTGRNESVRGLTEEWLRRHAVPHHTLDMRPEDIRTDDHILKPVMAFAKGWHPEVVEVVFEDRQRVVDAWRERGYTCFQVAPGNF